MQIIPEAPIDSYDIPVDFILTEKSLLQCTRKKTLNILY